MSSAPQDTTSTLVREAVPHVKLCKSFYSYSSLSTTLYFPRNKSKPITVYGVEREQLKILINHSSLNVPKKISGGVATLRKASIDSYLS